MPKKVLICYKKDEYEETVAVADNVEEMSKFMKVTPQAIYRSLREDKGMIYNHTERVAMEWVNLTA